MNKPTPLNLYLLGNMVTVQTKWKENTVVPLRNRRECKIRTSFENERREENGRILKTNNTTLIRATILMKSHRNAQSQHEGERSFVRARVFAC